MIITDLHSVWDGLILAKAIRNTPSKYNNPLPDEDIEQHLKGAIYDPFIRKVVWEGLGNKWVDELESWIECPAVPDDQGIQVSRWDQTKQLLLGGNPNGVVIDDEVICPYHWSKPIHQMNCDFVWPKEMDEPPYGHPFRPRSEPYLELDTPEYGGMIADEWILEKLMATGGIRLASILNWLFATV